MIAATSQVLAFLGQLYETQGKWDIASMWYERGLQMKWTRRQNYISEAIVGLIRIKHAQGDYAAIPLLLKEAEQLAQLREYNDQLASLQLTQGHLAWEIGNRAEVLPYYKRAMIYALRHNRFLLDELLIGRPQGTTSRPIIPYCREYGDNGKEVLIELHNWWKRGINNIDTLHSDTTSPTPNSILLWEAEKIAREREPGDGMAQKSVIEQIEAAL